MNAKVCSRRAFDISVPIAISTLILASGCSPKAPTPTEVVRPVKTMIVSAGAESSVRTFPGRVEASNKVELAFQVSGLLVSLPVREGQKVTANEVVAQLRQDEFQARLRALQGQLDRARADLQALRAGVRPEERLRLEAQVRAAEAKLVNARTEFDRFTQLLRNRTVSRAEFDRSETAYTVAQQNYQAALQTFEQGTVAREEDILAKEAEINGLEGQVVEAKLQLEDSTLRAPYDGVIAQRFVEQGQNVRANDRVIVFQDVDEIDIAVDVPEAVMAADLRSADIVQMLASFNAAPGLLFPVHIKEIAKRADPITQTFTIRVGMKVPPGLNLLPGMTGTVTLTYRRASILGGQISVPITAIIRESTGAEVAWTIAPDGSVERRPVKTGSVTGSSIVVLEGLQPGERIAVAGVPFLREGMKVHDLGDQLEGNRS
ncbi:MAG: efflux RND transporter periplasmic adaptor subunit [Verrucomicrobia bacterium]|nr:efflux RND transporter periplasmic adaptor subunit [Verrucomicrobiota bacterium]